MTNCWKNNTVNSPRNAEGASLFFFTQPCVMRSAFAVLTLLVCVGCGNGRYPIAGEVTFDGKPVESGTIVFEPADGQGPTTGGKIKDGKYALTDNAAPLPGKKKVRISAGRKTGRLIPAGPPAPPDMMVEEIIRYIPKTYNQQTTLACEVAPNGSRQIDFDLKSR